jgi:hypothetical protein
MSANDSTVFKSNILTVDVLLLVMNPRSSFGVS